MSGATALMGLMGMHACGFMKGAEAVYSRVHYFSMEFTGMKAEERHELRENDLATWLQYGLWTFLKQNGSYFLLVLALGFLGYQLWNMYQRKQEVARQTAWNQLHQAAESVDAVEGIKNLRGLVESSPLKEVKAQACLSLGGIYDRLLAYPSDLNRMQLSPEVSLTNAYDYYQQALTIQGDDLLIAGKAHLGVAGVLEDRGEWDKAKAEYEILADPKGKFANTAFVELAKERIATLEDRKKAPQLAAAYRSFIRDQAIKVPLGAGTTLPSGLPDLPGMLGTPDSLTFPRSPLSPSTPASAPAPVTPFIGPTIPGIGPTAPATGAEAPATQPK